MMHLTIKPIPKVDDNHLFIQEYLESKIKSNYKNTDSGFDLPLPENIVVPKNSIGFKIPLGVAAQPTFVDNNPRGYTLFPRSSTGSKTPLRLSNGTGIIDYEYRGEITACVDNISDSDFEAKRGVRLFQLCSPDLSPISIDISDVLNTTSRNIGGYGSTGT
tara:strand:- start:918 stop:1400 length:483 start_codon:yes stop_codon:yes gene_type:complete